MMNDHVLAVKFVNTLCKTGDMHGWGGDVSEEYRAEMVEHIEKNFKNMNEYSVHIAAFNLKTYGGWSDGDISELYKKCDFEEVGKEGSENIIWRKKKIKNIDE